MNKIEKIELECCDKGMRFICDYIFCDNFRCPNKTPKFRKDSNAFYTDFKCHYLDKWVKSIPVSIIDIIYVQ